MEQEEQFNEWLQTEDSPRYYPEISLEMLGLPASTCLREREVFCPQLEYRPKIILTSSCMKGKFRQLSLPCQKAFIEVIRFREEPSLLTELVDGIAKIPALFSFIVFVMIGVCLLLVYRFKGHSVKSHGN